MFFIQLAAYFLSLTVGYCSIFEDSCSEEIRKIGNVSFKVFEKKDSVHDHLGGEEGLWAIGQCLMRENSDEDIFECLSNLLNHSIDEIFLESRSEEDVFLINKMIMSWVMAESSLTLTGALDVVLQKIASSRFQHFLKETKTECERLQQGIGMRQEKGSGTPSTVVPRTISRGSLNPDDHLSEEDFGEEMIFKFDDFDKVNDSEDQSTHDENYLPLDYEIFNLDNEWPSLSPDRSAPSARRPSNRI